MKKNSKTSLLVTFTLLACLCYAQTPSFTITDLSLSYQLTCYNPSINLVATSDFSAPVSYFWSYNSFTANTSSVSLTAPGAYTVTSSSGSLNSSMYVWVTQNIQQPMVTISPTFQNITCTLSSVTQVTANVTSLSSNVQQIWISPLGGSLIANGQISSYLPGTPGTYTYFALNKINGCKTTRTFTVSSSQSFPTFSLVN